MLALAFVSMSSFTSFCLYCLTSTFIFIFPFCKFINSLSVGIFFLFFCFSLSHSFAYVHAFRLNSIKSWDFVLFLFGFIFSFVQNIQCNKYLRCAHDRLNKILFVIFLFSYFHRHDKMKTTIALIDQSKTKGKITNTKKKEFICALLRLDSLQLSKRKEQSIKFERKIENRSASITTIAGQMLCFTLSIFFLFFAEHHKTEHWIFWYIAMEIISSLKNSFSFNERWWKERTNPFNVYSSFLFLCIASFFSFLFFSISFPLIQNKSKTILLDEHPFIWLLAVEPTATTSFALKEVQRMKEKRKKNKIYSPKIDDETFSFSFSVLFVQFVFIFPGPCHLLPQHFVWCVFNSMFVTVPWKNHVQCLAFNIWKFLLYSWWEHLQWGKTAKSNFLFSVLSWWWWKEQYMNKKKCEQKILTIKMVALVIFYFLLLLLLVLL